MIHTEKQNHLDFLETSITYLENSGFENIKADIDGYETPTSYRKKGSDIVVTPDIVATKAGRKHYFDIGLKSEKTTLLKSKWRFLDVMARMKKQRFKIITKRGHYKFTNAMLDAVNLEKKLIKL